MVDVDSRAEINSTLLIVELICRAIIFYLAKLNKKHIHRIQRKGIYPIFKNVINLDFKFKVFVDFTD